MEDNLLDAMQIAVFEPPYSYESFTQDFQSGTQGVVSFTFNGIRETLTYIPVRGTDWQLTYLIRESVISERIRSISEGTVRRSIVQSVLTVAAMLVMFGFIISQTKRNSRLLLEQETAEAASRVKQEELEHRLALQEKLLEEERHREQQDKMITALAADYWSVYYLELDKDEGVCYISIDTNGKKLRFDLATPQVENAISRIGILYLPQLYILRVFREGKRLKASSFVILLPVCELFKAINSVNRGQVGSRKNTRHF